MKKKKPRVLIVDDEEHNLTIFRGTFRKHLQVFTANSGESGIALLEKEEEPIPIIISDQRMPQMTGVDFLRRIRERWPHSIRMVLTAYTDVDAIIDAINLGNVYKFIYKPWDREDLLRTILNAVETYELRERNQILTDELLRKEKLATVGRLVSGLGHEIGNQLSSLTLSSVILKKYPDDEFLTEKMETIRNSFSMIHGMVKEIRDFSRAGNRELALEAAMLHETLEQTLSLLNYDPDVRRCLVETNLDDQITALIHKDKMQQVVINLVKNAAQAIPEEVEGKIEIELLKVGAEAVLRIRDNGPGIPEQIRERIWEPFFTTKEESGSGLGLDICRQIVQAHNGTIGFESDVGGATFEMRVPLADSPTD